MKVMEVARKKRRIYVKSIKQTEYQTRKKKTVSVLLLLVLVKSTQKLKQSALYSLV